MTPFLLCAGSLELELSPSIGGAIRNFWKVGRDGVRRPLMRESHSDEQNVLGLASFPLVPFVNRVRGGEFPFRGETVRLSPNMAGDPSPLHGQGWLGPWELVGHGNQDAELHFVHPAGEWPWDYEALQLFALDPDGLTARLSCLNTSDRPMPCGLGFHPHFPCTPQTRLDTRVDHVWEIDEHVLPTVKVPATGRFDLHDRKVCGQGLDHGFGGWGGKATISGDGVTITMTSSDADYFQLYSPATGGIFVAEPVTHANAAMNEPEERWSELGLKLLEPGGEMTLTMRLEIADSA